MNKYSNLVNNSIIFAIGNLGTKVIVMLLVPLYTYTLTRSEYGSADLTTSNINLLLPIVSLSIFEASLRFVMDKSFKVSKVLTNAILVSLLSSIGIVIVTLIIIIVSPNHIRTVTYMSIILFLQMFQVLFAQYLRGIGKIKSFALNGIINALSLAIFNIILLIIFNYKVDGYFLSIIIANIISNIYLICCINPKHFFQKKYIDFQFIKMMLDYSIPLIPNSLMWWIVNTSSRYFIVFFHGVSSNGLFAVSAKIPNIITIFQSIFFQAWQLSAIDEFDQKDRNIFYQQVFSVFSSFMFSLTALVILLIKPIIHIVVSHQFYSSWKFVPFLLIGVLFSSFSSFMGTIYIASKQTNEIMKSSFVGSIANLLACLVFVPTIGVNGAAIASAVSFILIFLYRYRDIEKKINLKINLNTIFLSTVLLILEIISLYTIEFLTVVPVLVLLFFNKDKIKTMMNYFKNKQKSV